MPLLLSNGKKAVNRIAVNAMKGVLETVMVNSRTNLCAYMHVDMYICRCVYISMHMLIYYSVYFIIIRNANAFVQTKPENVNSLLLRLRFC